ncbi:putative transcription factor C2C2-CO-like family [Helianthus debilis subsp. tardiflorus]
MIEGQKPANSVGGKMVRACDRCVRKRARWYCAADDAFLCQSCDASIHGANHFGGQHERVLLQTGPSKHVGSGEPEPTWHQGFTRRARTPRKRAKCSFKVEGKKTTINSPVSLVPEIGSSDASLLDDDEEVEQQQRLLYCVPVFDAFETVLCNESNEIGRSLPFMVDNNQEDQTCHLDDLHGFGHPTDDNLELMEFVADVESLLGKEFDNTSCKIEDLGLTNNYKEEDDTKNIETCFDENKVKVEDKEVEEILGFDFDATRETLDWDFDYESTMMIKEEEMKVVAGIEREHTMTVLSDQCHEKKVRTSSMVLRINYEDVINTWGDQGSPWTNGTRPELNSDGYWPDFMGSQWAWNTNPSYGGVGRCGGGREARVSRYREKRRSRLFSKKIRYEVRKLNAEKRPRMKGRFVKRGTFEEPPSTSCFPTYLFKTN